MPFPLQDAYRLQLSMFLADVRWQVASLPGLRAALSLYSRISLDRLAALLQLDPASLRQEREEEGGVGHALLLWASVVDARSSASLCRTALMALRHKAHAVDSDGVVAPSPEAEFTITEVSFVCIEQNGKWKVVCCGSQEEDSQCLRSLRRNMISWARRKMQTQCQYS